MYSYIQSSVFTRTQTSSPSLGSTINPSVLVSYMHTLTQCGTHQSHTPITAPAHVCRLYKRSHPATCRIPHPMCRVGSINETIGVSYFCFHRRHPSSSPKNPFLHTSQSKYVTTVASFTQILIDISTLEVSSRLLNHTHSLMSCGPQQARITYP